MDLALNVGGVQRGVGVGEDVLTLDGDAVLVGDAPGRVMATSYFLVTCAPCRILEITHQTPTP